MSFPGSSDDKESTCNAGDWGLIPESGRFPGGGHGNLLQYSYLENPVDRGSWQITVRRVVESRTRLNDYHFHFILIIDVSVELPFLIFVCFIFGCAGSSLLFVGFLCWQWVNQGYSLVVVHRLVIAVTFLTAEHGLIGSRGFSSCGNHA